jgi:hypothetical protein
MRRLYDSVEPRDCFFEKLIRLSSDGLTQFYAEYFNHLCLVWVRVIRRLDTGSGQEQVSD